MQRFFIAALISLLPLSACLAQTTTWLPKGKLFVPNYLDPTEAQMTAGISAYQVDEGEEKDRLNIPLGVGFYRGIVQKKTEEGKKWQLGIDFMMLSQFSWRKHGEPWNTYQRRLFSIDYRVGGVFSYQIKEDLVARARFFHLSSHWGDDHIIYNFIRKYTDSLLNYEQIDFTLSKQKGDWDLYAGVGTVIFPKKVFDGITVQLGATWQKEVTEKFSWVAGTDIKLLQHYQFRPNIKLAGGIQFGNSKQRPVRLMAEYYNGYPPYLHVATESIQWLGMSMYFSIL